MPPRAWVGRRLPWSGLADGTLPISHALAHGPDRAVEEERRLLYVGITRARKHLELSWALARAPGGRQSRKPSRFLTGIAPQTRVGPAQANKPKAPARRHPALPGVQRGTDHHAVNHVAALRNLSVDIDEVARPTQGMAAGHRPGAQRPGLRGVHRQHAHRHRRVAATDDAALVAIPGIGARKLAVRRRRSGTGQGEAGASVAG